MQHTQAVTTDHRPLSELNLMDDFLFQEMLAQEDIGEEFCRILLRTILGKPIQKVHVLPQKNLFGADTNKHGIRMDAYIESFSYESGDAQDRENQAAFPDIYDVEPNRHYDKHTLPKRVRYYHGLIDTQILNVGSAYTDMQNVIIIIMILPYDPFGKNRMRYTIQNQCMEDSSVPYDDGVKKIFLYTKGTEGNPSQELQDMLKYIETTIEENVTNKDIEAIHQLVEKVKLRKEVGIRYMKSWELEQIYRSEAKEEGLTEGRKEGLAEGLEQGREQGIKALISICRDFHISEKETIFRLMDNFELSEAEAREYVGDD